MRGRHPLERTVVPIIIPVRGKLNMERAAKAALLLFAAQIVCLAAMAFYLLIGAPLIADYVSRANDCAVAVSSPFECL